MSQKEQREGSGALFTAQKKNSKAPDYFGDLKLDRDYRKGEIIKLSGWYKKTPKNHLISIAVNNWKSDKPEPSPAYGTDDEIPF
jgi:hypothetical protein